MFVYKYNSGNFNVNFKKMDGLLKMRLIHTNLGVWINLDVHQKKINQ